MNYSNIDEQVSKQVRDAMVGYEIEQYDKLMEYSEWVIACWEQLRYTQTDS